MDFTMPIAGVGGLHQHVSLPVLLRDRLPRLSSAAQLLGRLRRLRERRDQWKSAQSGVRSSTALLQIGAAARLVLLVVMLSTHPASQVTWTATSRPVLTAVFTCMFCIHGCASSPAKQ
jgi:hypothetical protein